MKLLNSSLLLLMLTAGLSAFPRWAVQEDLTCGTCHQYQGGGGARNAYGKDFVSETLVLKDLQWPWRTSENEGSFSVGLDTRYMMIGQEGRDLRHFPMQFALYGGFEFAGLIGHLEVNRLPDDTRLTGGIRYEGLPFESYLALQKELPALGWRVDDHSLYIRGGNLTPLNFQSEGMPFTPFLEPPMHLALGTSPWFGLELTFTAGNEFITEDPLPDSGIFYAGKLNYRYTGNDVVAQFNLGFLQESDVEMAVTGIGLSALGFTYLGELSRIYQWPRSDLSNQAVLQQLSYRVLQGVELVGRYEFFDPNLDYLTGSLQRVSLGVDLFLIPGAELKFSYRQAQLDLPDLPESSGSQFLTQIHLYL